MADVLTPGEVAQALGVQPRTVRRMAAAYERVWGPLPRDTLEHRLWPLEAVRRVQAAHAALGTGKVTSLDHALELVRDGADLPQRVMVPAPADALAELLAEVRALRALAEAQGRELAALREVVEGRRELPPSPPAQPAPTSPPPDLGESLQDAMRAALDPERLRVALHAAAPPSPAPEPARPARGRLSALLARLGL